MDGDRDTLNEGLTRAYAPLIGRELLALSWMPISCDTQSVVANLRCPAFAYSGGASLDFGEAANLFLTWTKHYPYLLQATTEAAAWSPHSLDRVYASHESPWAEIEGARLTAVELFTGPGARGGLVGARHGLAGLQGNTFLCIASGYVDGVQEGVDLWVSVDNKPPNVGDLTSVVRLGR